MAEFIVNVSGRKLVYLGNDTRTVDIVQAELESEFPGLEDVELDEAELEVDISFEGVVRVELDETVVEDAIKEQLREQGLAELNVESVEEV